jgi:hypothetical protein
MVKSECTPVSTLFKKKDEGLVIMANMKTKLLLRTELSYLGEAAKTFENEKRDANAEALRNATLQVAAMREDLAKMIWQAINIDGATVADVSTVSGYSRATVYRFLDEHVENTGGNPGALIEAVRHAKRQKRFTYDGITEGDVIWVIDTENENKKEPLAFDPYYSEWVHQTLGKRGSHWWDKVPELELTVEAIRAGEFIPESDLPEVLESVLVQIDTEAARAELEARKSGKATKSEAKPEVEEDMAFEDPLVWE